MDAETLVDEGGIPAPTGVMAQKKAEPKREKGK